VAANNVKSDTSSDPEKYQYDEDLHVPALSATTEAKLMRKIDLRVVPCLCVLYLLAFLDRCVSFFVILVAVMELAFAGRRGAIGGDEARTDLQSLVCTGASASREYTD